MSRNYTKSNEYLTRSEQTVPLGSQTFSKSKTQLPEGVSPFFAEKALGSQVWDVDGNQYTDYVNGLLSITLGHCEPDVVAAVQDQLQKGTIYSLASPLEFEVAELICDMVPCAEKVRFGKNGSDATAGAIRVARAYTKRDHVLVCGYHGWQDWYIGSTSRDLGVPKATRELTHTFTFNDIDSVSKLFNELDGKVAAVIMEPMNIAFPEDNFIHKVKDLAHKNGALFILDETITGFRFSNGGAQELFDVTPDLATFGKGLANGYPLSAVAGKSEYMNLMEEIFFSFTFGGETLSLVAAKTVLTKLKNQPITSSIRETGEYLSESLNRKLTEHNMDNLISLSGHPSWTILSIKDAEHFSAWDIKTLFLQEMFENGIISIGSHNLSYAHTKSDIDQLMEVYGAFFEKLQQALDSKDIDSQIRGKKLEPLFKVR